MNVPFPVMIATMPSSNGTSPAAPTLDDYKLTPFSTSTTSHNFATSGLDVAGLRTLVLIGNNSATATLSSFTGDGGGSADTSAGIKLYDTNPRLHLREMTVVDTLDTNWVLTLANGARPVIMALSIADLVTLTAPDIEAGAGASLPAHSSRLVTGGPHNLLVIQACVILGAHVTNPPTAPSGYTLVGQAASLTNDPTGSAVTLGVAQKTFAVADLTWTSGEATVPAATWGGLADIGTQLWRTSTIIGIAS